MISLQQLRSLETMTEPRRMLRGQERQEGQTGQEREDRPQRRPAQQSLLLEDSIQAVFFEMERLGLLAELKSQLPHLTAMGDVRCDLLTTVRQLKASNIFGQGTEIDRARIIRRAETLLANSRGSQPNSTDRSQKQPDSTRQQSDPFHPVRYQFGQAQALYEDLVDARPAHHVEPRSLASIQISKEMDDLVIVLAYLGRCGIIMKNEAREILKPRDEDWRSPQQTLLRDILKRIDDYENVAGRSADQCQQLLRTRSVIRAYRCATPIG